MTPERDASGYRRYGRQDLVRVAVILRNQAAGMSLEQIGVLLDAEARGRHDVLEAHLRDLDERARSIERSRAMTEHALRCRAHDIAACPVSPPSSTTSSMAAHRPRWSTRPVLRLRVEEKPGRTTST